MIGDFPQWPWYYNPQYPPCQPQPMYTYTTPVSPACWNEIACTAHKCRELGCACLRDRSLSAASDEPKETK